MCLPSQNVMASFYILSHQRTRLTVLLHTLVSLLHFKSHACGQWIYIKVLIKVDTSGASVSFMEHYTAHIVGLQKLREASKG